MKILYIILGLFINFCMSNENKEFSTSKHVKQYITTVIKHDKTFNKLIQMTPSRQEIMNLSFFNINKKLYSEEISYEKKKNRSVNYKEFHSRYSINNHKYSKDLIKRNISNKNRNIRSINMKERNVNNVNIFNYLVEIFHLKTRKIILNKKILNFEENIMQKDILSSDDIIINYNHFQNDQYFTNINSITGKKIARSNDLDLIRYHNNLKINEKINSNNINSAYNKVRNLSIKAKLSEMTYILISYDMVENFLETDSAINDKGKSYYSESITLKGENESQEEEDNIRKKLADIDVEKTVESEQKTFKRSEEKVDSEIEISNTYGSEYLYDNPIRHGTPLNDIIQELPLDSNQIDKDVSVKKNISATSDGFPLKTTRKFQEFQYKSTAKDITTKDKELEQSDMYNDKTYLNQIIKETPARTTTLEMQDKDQDTSNKESVLTDDKLPQEGSNNQGSSVTETGKSDDYTTIINPKSISVTGVNKNFTPVHSIQSNLYILEPGDYEIDVTIKLHTNSKEKEDKCKKQEFICKVFSTPVELQMEAYVLGQNLNILSVNPPRLAGLDKTISNSISVEFSEDIKEENLKDIDISELTIPALSKIPESKSTFKLSKPNILDIYINYIDMRQFRDLNTLSIVIPMKKLSDNKVDNKIMIYELGGDLSGQQESPPNLNINTTESKMNISIIQNPADLVYELEFKKKSHLKFLFILSSILVLYVAFLLYVKAIPKRHRIIILTIFSRLKRLFNFYNISSQSMYIPVMEVEQNNKNVSEYLMENFGLSEISTKTGWKITREFKASLNINTMESEIVTSSKSTSNYIKTDSNFSAELPILSSNENANNFNIEKKQVKDLQINCSSSDFSTADTTDIE